MIQRHLLFELTMLNLKPFKTLFTIFYIFGVFSHASKGSKRILSLLLRIANISVIGCILYILQNLSYARSYLFEAYARWVLIITTSIIFVPIIETLFHSRKAHQSLQIMSEIIDNLEKCLKIKYPYNAIKTSIFLTFSLQFIVIATIVITKLFVGPKNVEKILIFIFVDMIKCVHLLHFTFYTNFIKFALITLNKKIVMLIDGNDDWCFMRISNIICVLQHLKLIHFQIARLLRRINVVFGWYLVMRLIDVVMMMIYSGFWAFVFTNNIAGGKLSTLNIRN